MFWKPNCASHPHALLPTIVSSSTPVSVGPGLCVLDASALTMCRERRYFLQKKGIRIYAATCIMSELPPADLPSCATFTEMNRFKGPELGNSLKTQEIGANRTAERHWGELEAKPNKIKWVLQRTEARASELTTGQWLTIFWPKFIQLPIFVGVTR